MKARYVLSAVALGFGLVAVLLLLLMRAVPLARADPGIYYVRQGAIGNCLSAGTACGGVQQAINLATSPGDEVWVATGIYTENLEINHSVKLRGGWDNSFTVQDPASSPTILDGGGDHNVRVRYAPQAEVTVEGFALRHGQDGIHIWTGNVTVERCAILDVNKQGFEIDGGTVVISTTQILTAQQGIEVDDGIVQVADVHIAHTNREGLLIEQGGTVTFTGSTIKDCGQEGVQVENGNLWLFDNYIHDVISDGIRIEAAASASIISNVVRAVAENPGEDYHGIQIDGDQLVRGNLVTDVDDRGICARKGAPTIENNTVSDVGGDGIRTAATCTDVEIRGNTVYSAGNDCIDARGATVIVAGNTVTGCADNGIKADLIGSWVRLDANWGLNNPVGIAIRDAPVFTLTNNVVGDSITTGVELAGTGMGFVYHNTLVGGGTGRQGTGLVVLDPLAATLANNIVVSHDVGITKTAGASLDVSYTMLWGNGSDPISGTGVITQAPLFVAPASQDYHILRDSPAVDAGIDVGVLTDVDGDPRLTAPDVGADEVVRKVHLPLVMRAY
ncbi:MAG: right-handed parallel beta-helix repeat-containing protein [Anaerolineae bacterium]